jgi:molecular chaperone DnaK
VYDLGGGTFDISILDVGEGVFQVRATSGDTFLGGDDFDQRIIDHLADAFEGEHAIDLRRDRQALQRLKEAAEKAKVELSSMLQTEINLPYISADALGPKHLVTRLTRAKLEQLTTDLVDRTLAPVQQALEDAGLTAAQIDEVVMVGGMTRMPVVQERVRGLFRKDPHKGVNPDEVVAVGAAIQAGVLGGDVTDVLLLDVTPLTLAIETLGSVATPQIERNTTIPARRTQTFSTAADGQTQVEIHVLQGERSMAGDNKSLGRFILDGIPPAPRGIPQIEVTFDIDANGILKVTARDKASGRSQHITLEASSGLSETEVEQLRQDAAAHAEADRKNRDLAEARNLSDAAAYEAGTWLREHPATVPRDQVDEVEHALSELNAKIKGANPAEIKKASAALTKLVARVDGRPPTASDGATSATQQDDGNGVDGRIAGGTSPLSA